MEKKIGEKRKERERDEEKHNAMQTMKQTFQVAEDLQAYECHLSKGVTEHSSRDVSYRLVITLFLFSSRFVPRFVSFFNSAAPVAVMHPYANSRTSESASGSGCRRDAEMSGLSTARTRTELFRV